MWVMRVAGVDSRQDGNDGVVASEVGIPAFASLRVPLRFAKGTGDREGRAYGCMNPLRLAALAASPFC